MYKVTAKGALGEFDFIVDAVSQDAALSEFRINMRQTGIRAVEVVRVEKYTDWLNRILFGMFFTGLGALIGLWVFALIFAPYQ